MQNLFCFFFLTGQQVGLFFEVYLNKWQVQIPLTQCALRLRQ